MKEERRRCRRASVRKQATEWLMFVVLISMTCYNLSPERIVWMKERSSHWWEHVVKSMFTPQDWLENFCMSQCTFMYLCDEFWSSIEKRDTEMRRAVPTDKRVALTLWFLATGADYRTISHPFGISKWTVCLVTKDVCSIVIKSLLPHYTMFPTGVAFDRDH